MKGSVMFDEIQKSQLNAKLDPAHVRQREQGGRKLDYVEGWFAISEANRIFGHSEWDRETVIIDQVRLAETVKDRYGKDQWRVGYMAKVRVTVRANGAFVSREGIGFGSGAMGDLGDAIESAIKEAETDAMKRALMTFGNPFGLALYDKSRANVGIEQEPQSTPAKSSALLKKEGSWGSLKSELDNDLLDCRSTISLAKIRADYREKALDKRWPKAWLEALRNEFDTFEAGLEAQQNLMAG
jgi:DNA recombination protein Rad52